MLVMLLLTVEGQWTMANTLPAPQSVYALKVGVTPSGAGSLNQSNQELEEGQTIYMRAYTNSDFKFEYWSMNGDTCSTQSSFTFTMPAFDVELIAHYQYNPSNPNNPDPADQTKKYALILNTKPSGAGYFNRESGERFAGNQEVYLRAYNNSDFVFSHWMSADTVVSNSSSFNFLMPEHDAVLTAVYNYQPANPANPDTAQIFYTVTLETKPAGAGYFSWNNTTSRVARSSCDIYAYNNSDFVFREWQHDGVTVSTDRNYRFQMPANDIHLVAIYDYNPSNPGNPNKNYWNEATGEIIVDDFTADNLSNAIYNLVGDSNDKVQMITVAGPVSQYDWGVVNNYSNCSFLDMSRTYGLTYVPSYNFSGNKSLTNVILPAGIERIDYYAFNSCSSLQSLTCYALTPPSLGNSVFEGVADGLVVYVPAAALSLYQEAEGWKNYTILPLANEVCALEVNLPEETDVSLYKDMFIELINIKSGQKQRYVINDRLTYTFNSLIKKTSYNVYLKNSLDDVLGEIDGIDIVDQNVSVTFESLKVPRTLTLTVLTPDNEDVTAQTTVTWTSLKDAYLNRGITLSNQLEGAKVKYRITLSQALGMKYQLPTETTYEVQADNNIIYTLADIPQTAIAGKVTDFKTGQAINGATMTISQMLNGLYSKTFSTKTNKQGEWSLQVYEAKTDVTASMADYISQSQSFESQAIVGGDLQSPTEIPTFELKDINGTTISLNLTYTTIDGETQNYYSDYANVAYQVYNETAKQRVTEMNVQYPQIVLQESLPEGTELRVTATSKNLQFAAVSATTTVNDRDMANVTLPIKQWGGIEASFGQTENSGIVGILYDGNDRLVKKFNYNGTKLTINELTDGDYTLVTMGSSLLFNSVATVSQFAEAGLREGVDFVKNKVRVNSGAYTTISNARIPLLDETKLYYTGQNTLFSVNKTQVTAGQYLTLRGQVDFKSVYASAVSDIKLIFELPDDSTFVENSVMLGRSLASYMTNGRQVIVPLESASPEQVRFCIMPTAGGKFTSSASVQFTLNGRSITQPIGDVNYTVKDLSISIPEVIARTQLPVRGVAIGKSEVEVYDNGKLIGKTTAYANGSWSTNCDLGNPTNLSSHVIYAKVKTPKGNEMLTESKTVIYDRNLIQPNTVQMSFYNGWLRKTISVTFDFKEGKTDVSDYMFYTGTDVTFVIDLTNNSPEVVNGVTLNVFTDRDQVRRLQAVYNQKNDRWVAVSRFESNNLPVNLSINIDADVEAKLDEVTVNDGKDDYEENKQKIDDTGKDIETALANLEAELNNENPNADRVIELINVYRDCYEDIIVDYVPRGKVNENTPYDPANDDYLTGLKEATTDEEVTEIINNLPTISESDYQKLMEDYTPNYHQTFTPNLSNIVTPEITINFNGAPQNPEPGTLYIPESTWRVDDSNISFSKVSLVNNSNDAITIDFGTKLGSYTETIDGMQTLGQQLDDLSKAYISQWNLGEGGTFGLDLLDMAYDVEREGMRVTQAMLAKAKNADGSVNSAYLKTLLARAKANHPRIVQISKIKTGLRYGSAALGGLFAAVDGYGAYKSYRTWDDIIDVIRELCKQEATNKYVEKSEQYRKWITIRKSVKAVGGLGTTIVGYIASGSAVVTGGTSLLISGGCFGIGMGLSYWETQYNRTDQQHRAEIKRLVRNDENCKPFPDDDDIPNPPFSPITPIHDPSGYVYEAVASNRLQGVTATAYYKETVEDMYGDLHENVVLWDAEEYAQQNPLFTDEYGMYQWDVPQGLWQVKFEKEGYQTIYSEWLPVPPPQMEVNVAMTQTLQPTVKSGRASAEGIEFEFDKYMDPETLNGDNIKVTCNDVAVSGTIELLNEEAAYQGQTQTYASKVFFKMPEGVDLLSTDKVRLTVDKAVKSYAGVPMQEDYTQDFDVIPVVRRVVADVDLVNVVYGDQRTIKVSAEPGEAAKGKTLLVRSSSELIATTTENELVLDDNGEAELTIVGELPGSTVLSFMVKDTEVESTLSVNVKEAAKLVAIAPRASRISGTQVYRGTKIQLTSDTENAVIYYTLDGSCPCDENNPNVLTYNADEPIVIDTDNVTIKAMTTGQDLTASEVSEFSYTLKKTALNYLLPTEGWLWLSHNLETSVVINDFVEGTNVNRILSQTQEIIQDPNVGYIGNLTELHPAVGYKVHLNAEGSEKRLSGNEYNAIENTVAVNAGWNWIGYPLNQVMTINEALAYYMATSGDYIVGQDGYAEFVDGTWKGSLEGLKPGQGYLFKSANNAEISFNTNIVSNAVSLIGKRNLLKNSPWAPAKYAYPDVMPLTAHLYENGVKVDADEYVVGAFSGTECRGVGLWNGDRLLMSVYGQPGDDISFLAMHKATGRCFDLTEQLSFMADNVGTWKAPYTLSINGETTRIKQLESQFAVTPALFSDHLTMTAGGKDITSVTLTNVNGQTVVSLSGLGKGATVTTGQLPEGMYIVTVQAGGQSYYKKVMKTNK